MTLHLENYFGSGVIDNPKRAKHPLDSLIYSTIEDVIGEAFHSDLYILCKTKDDANEFLKQFYKYLSIVNNCMYDYSKELNMWDKYKSETVYLINYSRVIRVLDKTEAQIIYNHTNKWRNITICEWCHVLENGEIEGH